MHLLPPVLVSVTLALPAFAGPLVADARGPHTSERSLPTFELGGSTMQMARLPDIQVSVPSDPFRLALAQPVVTETSSEKQTDFGALTLFGGDMSEGGPDVFRLGTAVTRGAATAGVLVSYEPEGTRAPQSSLFVDYALSKHVSIGVQGIRDGEGIGDPVTRLGLSAAFATENGSFVQGGVFDAPDTEPVFGVSMELKF